MEGISANLIHLYLEKNVGYMQYRNSFTDYSTYTQKYKNANAVDISFFSFLFHYKKENVTYITNMSYMPVCMHTHLSVHIVYVLYVVSQSYVSHL